MYLLAMSLLPVLSLLKLLFHFLHFLVLFVMGGFCSPHFVGRSCEFLRFSLPVTYFTAFLYCPSSYLVHLCVKVI
jgi:hypothetical protein